MLDLSTVEMVDGGGLGLLVFLHKWTRAAGIQLKLVNPCRLALAMLIRTGLASVLHVSSIDDVVEIFCNSELCDLERDSSSRILLDQSQRQINAGGPASRCPALRS